MSKQQMITILKTFQNAPMKSKTRREYLRAFEKGMIYETTKCEHPELTIKTVEKVLHKLSPKYND
jgi:hypothetical protein